VNPAAQIAPTDVPLAVVIPAFRRRHLRETLASFAAQTDRRFHLYVADDGSPESLAEVVEPFHAALALTYRRFDDNLGIPGLVRHWQRAIALTREPWLWLFSDDDVAAPDCVAAVLRQLGEQPPPLLRFDVEFIDDASRPLRREAPFPDRLAAVDYARRLLERRRDPCMIQNVVFSRAAYEAGGGFTPTIGGYCADYATWPRFARGGGIRRLRGGGVRFRYHDDSVGAHVGFYGDRRTAVESYRDTLRALRLVAGPAEAARADWRRAELGWFAHWFRYLPRPLRPDERIFVAAVMAELWPRHSWARLWHFESNYVRVRVREVARRHPRLDALRAWIARRSGRRGSTP